MRKWLTLMTQVAGPTLFCFLLLMAITGCASKPALTPKIVYQDVPVPVPTPCKVNVDLSPKFKDSDQALRDVGGPMDVKTFKQVKMLLQGRDARDAWIVTSIAALKGCSGVALPLTPSTE